MSKPLDSLPSDNELDLKRKLEIERRERAEIEKKLSQTYDSLEVAQTKLDAYEKTASISPKKLRKLREKKGSATAFILCSDWHSEENISLESSNGLNECNLQIIEKRIEKIWQKGVRLLEFSRNIADIREIVLWLGGDLMNNQLHEEAAETNFLGPASAIQWVQDRVESGIHYLKQHAGVDLITVVTSYGNHGRTTRKRRIANGYDHSWEWCAYNNLARHHKDDKQVQFVISKSYHNWLERHGRTIRFHHGDAVRFHGGVGGVSIPLRKKIAQWNKSKAADLDIIGHFHEYNDDWRYSLNGCACGYNAYAIEIGAEYQPPSQTFVVTSGEYMKILNTPIYL